MVYLKMTEADKRLLKSRGIKPNFVRKFHETDQSIMVEFRATGEIVAVPKEVRKDG